MTMSVFEKHEALAFPRAIPDIVMSSLAEYTLLVLAILCSILYTALFGFSCKSDRISFPLNSYTKLIMLVVKDRRVVW
jgi:hypothetical protein